MPGSAAVAVPFDVDEAAPCDWVVPAGGGGGVSGRGGVGGTGGPVVAGGGDGVGVTAGAAGVTALDVADRWPLLTALTAVT